MRKRTARVLQYRDDALKGFFFPDAWESLSKAGTGVL